MLYHYSRKIFFLNVQCYLNDKDAGKKMNSMLEINYAAILELAIVQVH